MDSLDVGVDLDGVAYDFVDGLRQWLLTQGRSLASMPDATVWDFPVHQWGMTWPEFETSVREGIEAGHVFRIGRPFPMTAEALGALRAQGHRIHIVSNRDFGQQERCLDHTLDWLSEYRIPYDTITLSHDKTVVPVDIFIDDYPKNYDALEAAGHNPYLAHQAWNAKHPGRRVHDWNEFLDAVAALAGGKK